MVVVAALVLGPMLQVAMPEEIQVAVAVAVVITVEETKAAKAVVVLWQFVIHLNYHKNGRI
jgi:hypothetical protein